MTEPRVGKYRIGSVAKMTGFSADVLRAWERRYDLLSPKRGPGGQRLYSDEDVRVLRAIGRQLALGRPIGEIALSGRDALLDESPAGDPDPRHGARLFLDSACADLVDAAISLDGDRMQRILEEAFSAAAPETVITRLIEPAAREIGRAWAAGVCSVAGEHLATGLFTRRLQGLLHARSAANGPDRPRALCACLPDELHELPALIVAYHLARLGLRVTYLGASLPLEELEVAIRKLDPRGAYLSVSRAAVLEVHKPRLLELMERHGPNVAFVVGGRGITSADAELAAAGALLWPEARPVHELAPEPALGERGSREGAS